MIEDSEELRKNLSSPLWRIRNIYTIRNRKGKPEKFIPTKEQEAVLEQIYIFKRKKIFIPKARQLGMSTLIAIITLDSIMYGTGVQISISDFVSGNAKKKLEEKIVYAFDKLPDFLKNEWEVITHNKQSGEFRIRLKALKGVDKESAVYAGDQIRGGTNQLIHLSELGETQIKAPERAKEIIEGGLPSAESSLIIIETTWHGGKSGKLYRILNSALKTPDHLKDKDKDYFVIFFPWDTEPTYTHSGDPSQITDEIHAYFDDLQKENGKTYSLGQRLWYQRKKEDYGERIYSIYPSKLSEIFLAPVEGAVFAREVDQARTSGRISSFKHDPKRPVHTLWDIGAPQNTIVWYFQIIEDKFHFIDVDVVKNDDEEISGVDLNFSERVKMMNEKPYTYGYHYLPHDGRRKDDLRNRTTAQEDLKRHGLKGSILVVPRITQKYLAVDKTKQMFHRFHFDDERCGPALEGIAMYRRKQDPFDEKKFLNEFVHDWTSHLADSLMQLATAEIYHYLTSEGEEFMSNMMLDGQAVKALSAEMSRRVPEKGIVQRSGTRHQFVKSVNTPSWLNKWFAPKWGHSYMTIVHNGIFQVWQAPFTRDETSDPIEKDKPLRLVASSIPSDRIDLDILAEWAAMTSKIYGDCIVIPTLNESGDRLIEKLFERDCMIYRRDVRISQKAIGRERPAKKPGFDYTDQVKANCLEELISFVRDKKIEFWDPEMIMQSHVYTTSPDGVHNVEPGHDGRRIEAASIACSCINSATLFEGSK